MPPIYCHQKPCDPQHLTRLCNREVRVGAGTYQRSDGHRESCARSGKPTTGSVTERLRTCHGQHHDQVPELHCEYHHSSYHHSSPFTWITHFRLPPNNTNPTSSATTKPSSLKNPNLPGRTLQTPPPPQCPSSTYHTTSARSSARWLEQQSPTLRNKRALARRTLSLMVIHWRIHKTPNPMRPC